MARRVSRRARLGALAGAALISGLVALARPSTASAYNLYGWSWQSPNSLHYLIASSATGTAGYVGDAAGEWSGTPTPVSVAEGNHTGDILIDGSYDGPGVASRGGCDVVDSNGYCISGYGHIHFNLSQWGSNSTESFQKWSALHEMGHALGLDHSCNSQAVMFGPYNGCGTSYGCYTNSTTCFLQPQQDDIDGLNAKYPSAAYTRCAGIAPSPPAALALPSPGQVLGNLENEANQTVAKVVGTHWTPPGPLGRC